MVILGEARNGGDPNLHWEAATASPTATLEGLLSRYGGFQEVSAQPVARLELPSPSLVLVISLAGPLSLTRGVAGLAPTRSSAALVGVGCDPIIAAHGGTQTVLEVQLSPLAALRLFGVPASDLADQVVDLADLWDATVEFVERVAAAATWAERFHLLDTALAARVERGRQVDPVLVGAWQQLLDRRGDLGMCVLHEQTGWSRRRLAERFREQVGLPPKAMARLVRFQHAADLLRRPGHRSLAAIALSCGYYDQAHLNREFRELAGCTPTSFLAGLHTDTAGTGMAGG